MNPVEIGSGFIGQKFDLGTARKDHLEAAIIFNFKAMNVANGPLLADWGREGYFEQCEMIAEEGEEFSATEVPQPFDGCDENRGSDE